MASFVPSLRWTEPARGRNASNMPKHFSRITLSTTFFSVGLLVLAGPAGKDKVADPSVKSAQGTLWVDPVDIQSRNLLYGQGGKEHQPSGTIFSFVDEDLD